MYKPIVNFVKETVLQREDSKVDVRLTLQIITECLESMRSKK